jgi:hypothetical protein
MTIVFRYLFDHWPDIALALALAVIADYVRVGSRLREAVESFRNKRAERSVARLRERIAELEKYRDRLVGYSTSQQGIYMPVLGVIAMMLIFMCIGIVFALLEHAGIRIGIVLSVTPFVFAGLFGIMGYNYAVGVWTPEYSGLINKTEANIQRLKTKLAAKG